MDPFTAIMGASALVGLGMQLFGTHEATGAAKQEAAISKNIAGLQMQENQIRQETMEMSARREKIETARMTQLASAKALAGVVNQGAQFGSGASGGQSQITAEGGFQQAGIDANLAAGRKMFGFDQQIDQQKFLMADSQSNLASAQGMMNMGSSVTNASLSFMKMFGPDPFNQNQQKKV